MTRPPYHTILEMLGMIDEPDRSGLRRMYLENRERFLKTPGSTHNHQAWPGGYHDHVEDIMNMSILHYPAEESTGRPMPFTLSSSLKVLFLHDIEKPWKEELEIRTDPEKMRFRLDLLKRYGINLTPDEVNALTYVEGEKDDYSKRHRLSTPLAAWCHLWDSWSARGRPEYPGKGDPWSCRR